MVRAVIKLLLLFGLYLLLVGNTGADELAAGILCGAAACALSLAIPLIAERHFTFRRVPWFRLATATLGALAREQVQLGARLMTRFPEPGKIERRPFRAAGTRPEDGTRRGLVTLATSLTPNTYVLAVLTGRQELLVHRMTPSDPPTDREWPL